MRDSVFTRFRKWFQNYFVFFGPGLLLAITAAGEAGVTEAIEIGAHYGPTLIWVVIITLIFKYAFTNGIARYTLATNQTIFDALNRLPGPRNWGSYLIIGSYLMEMFAIGAMLVFSATFLDYLQPGIYSVFLIAVFLLTRRCRVRTEPHALFSLALAENENPLRRQTGMQSVKRIFFQKIHPQRECRRPYLILFGGGHHDRFHVPRICRIRRILHAARSEDHA